MSEFTHSEHTNALQDMINEYRALYESFESYKTEHSIPTETHKNKLNCEQSRELNCLRETSSLLVKERDEAKCAYQKLSKLVSTWNASTNRKDEMLESIRLAGDLTGIGYNSNDGSSSGNEPQLCLTKSKVQSLNFVRSSTVYDPYELVKEPVKATLIKEQAQHRGIGYVEPLKEAKPRQKFRNELKPIGRAARAVKPNWYYNCKPVQKRYMLYNRNYKPKAHAYTYYHTPQSRSSPSFMNAHTFQNTHRPKSLRVIQVWVPKGLILPGPK